MAAIHAREEATVEPDAVVAQQQNIITKHFNSLEIMDYRQIRHSEFVLPFVGVL